MFISPTFKAAWEEWLQYRKERKLAKYTPTGLQKTLTNLYNISGQNEETAIQIINQSIIQNWQGLFPLKNHGNTETHKPGTSTARMEALRNW
jgi:site-specific recombinase XerC